MTQAASPAPQPARATPAAPRWRSLLERWAEVVDAHQQEPPDQAPDRGLPARRRRRAVVTLGFPEAQSFLKDVAERRRAILEEASAGCSGMPVTVRCVATNLDVSAAAGGPGRTPPADRVKRIFGDDIVDVGDVD